MTNKPPTKAALELVTTVQRGALDEFQRKFCTSSSSNIRLLAPAGSGKTQSLLWRCHDVHQRQSGKARFLVVTFTRAARDELRSRLSGKELRDVSDAIEVATLNGWGYRRLRSHHHSPRLLTSEKDKGWCIQNTLQPVWGQYAQVATPMKQQSHVVGPVLMLTLERLKTLGFRHTSDSKSFEAHVRHLSDLGLEWLLQESLEKLAELEVLTAASIEDLMEYFVPFWKSACEAMIQQSLFTLEDQKYVALLDLQKQIEERRSPVGASRLTHVFVDEFQDINPLDLDLIRAIVDINKSDMTIVGDDDQAIFEWRGASPNYILDPKAYFGRCFDTHILERNYRCPRNIVHASQALIVRNKRRQEKRVTAMNQQDAEIVIIERGRFTESIDAVMDQIEEFLRHTGSMPSKLAIVSRKRAQLIPYQILMASKDIPFCAAEDLQIFMSNAFDNLKRMLLICARSKGPDRPLSLVEDILDLCNQVKRFPLKKADRNRLGTHLRLARPHSYQDAVDALASYDGPLKGANANRTMSFDFANRLSGLFSSSSVTDAIDVIGRNFSGLEKDYGKAMEDIFFVDPPFLYLAEFAKRYEKGFGRFISDLELAKDTLAQLPGEDGGALQVGPWSQPIHLMTALRAKGKEFDTVILLDLNDGIWPSRHAETDAQKEQERRLFYVAMTRAKRKLILTLSGRIGDHVASPSPYIAEAGFC